MPMTVPIQREDGPVATMAMPRVQATPLLSVRTLAWLAEHPLALVVVESVWDTLAELEAVGAHPRLLAALRFVLIHHEPTRTGRCRACRRQSLWRRRGLPCVVWRQIRGELLGHLSLNGHHRIAASRSVPR